MSDDLIKQVYSSKMKRVQVFSVAFAVASIAVVSMHGAVVVADMRQQRITKEVTSSGSKIREEYSGQWTEWFNTDSPQTGEGDFETKEKIEELDPICNIYLEVVGVQCRVVGTNATFNESSINTQNDRFSEPCTQHGIICLNTKQTSGTCQDYEIRFFCQYTSHDDNTDSSEPDPLFSNFNFQIYIILAVALVFIFSLRFLWTCLRNLRKNRRRQQQEQLHSRQRSASVPSSTHSDSSSHLADSPPSYSDLFGTAHPTSGIYSVPEEEVTCRTCGYPLAVEFLGGEDDHNQQQREETSVVVGESSGGVGDDLLPPALLNFVPPDSDRLQNVDVAYGLSSETGSVATSSSMNAIVLDSRSLLRQLSGNQVVPELLPSHLTHSSFCACACHHSLRSISGQGNVDRRYFKMNGHNRLVFNHKPFFPGMHRPVFDFPRTGSESSFTEPPDYQQALEILKKNNPTSLDIYVV